MQCPSVSPLPDSVADCAGSPPSESPMRIAPYEGESAGDVTVLFSDIRLAFVDPVILTPPRVDWAWPPGSGHARAARRATK